MMSLILLKLFIAIILEAYDHVKEKDEMLFNEDKIDKFNDAWKVYDPDVSLHIITTFLGDGLHKNQGPIELPLHSGLAPRLQ